MMRKWDDIESTKITERLRAILPLNVERGSVYYDLKKSPHKYVASTKKICSEIGGRYTSFPVEDHKSPVISLYHQSSVEKEM